jgi:hypothetical protein
MRKFILIAALALSTPAMGQTVSPLSPPVTPADIASIQAAIPQPATTVGSSEMVGGQVGSSMRYKREDWVPPRISRTGSCVLNALGFCTAAWTAQGVASPFPAGTTPVMLGDPVAINTVASFPISCNVTSAPTLTGVAVKCWQGQSSVVSILGATVLPFNATLLSGVTVTVSAFPGT